MLFSLHKLTKKKKKFLNFLGLGVEGEPQFFRNQATDSVQREERKQIAENAGSKWNGQTCSIFGLQCHPGTHNTVQSVLT